MRILVTGAAGMLGREVTAACHARDHEVVALAHAALDITDPGRGGQGVVPLRARRGHQLRRVHRRGRRRGRRGRRDAGQRRGARPSSRPRPPASAPRCSIPRATTSSTARAGAVCRVRPCPPRCRPTAAPSRRARPRSRSPTRATSSSAPRGCSASGGRTSSRRCCGSATSSPRCSWSPIRSVARPTRATSARPARP